MIWLAKIAPIHCCRAIACKAEIKDTTKSSEKRQLKGDAAKKRGGSEKGLARRSGVSEKSLQGEDSSDGEGVAERREAQEQVFGEESAQRRCKAEMAGERATAQKKRKPKTCQKVTENPKKNKVER